MEKLEKDIENLLADIHFVYTNLTPSKMLEVKDKLEILKIDIENMKRNNNFDNLSFYKGLFDDILHFCKTFEYKIKEQDHAKMRKLLEEHKNVGDYFTYVVFQLEDTNYYIFDKEFKKLTPGEIELIEFKEGFKKV